MGAPTRRIWRRSAARSGDGWRQQRSGVTATSWLTCSFTSRSDLYGQLVPRAQLRRESKLFGSVPLQGPTGNGRALMFFVLGGAARGSGGSVSVAVSACGLRLVACGLRLAACGLRLAAFKLV